MWAACFPYFHISAEVSLDLQHSAHAVKQRLMHLWGGGMAWGVWQEPCTPSANDAMSQQPVAHAAYGAHSCSSDEKFWAGCAGPMCLFPFHLLTGLLSMVTLQACYQDAGGR